MSLHVFEGEVEWLVAESSDDAAKLAVELFGKEAAEQCEQDLPDHWREWPDDRELTIVDVTVRETKLCSKWVEETGRGILCSMDY